MKKKFTSHYLPWILLLLILGLSAFFRFRGLNWGENTYLHPDERFLIWVTSSIESVDKFSDYFNTHISYLNPTNRGHGFFVYGTLPIFITRYLVEFFFELVGWVEISLTGRALSALFDLGSVFLLFFIGKKLFNQWVGLLAALFAGMAVLQIQQSHFYTVDTFATFFTTLAFYLAVLISQSEVYIKTNSNHEDSKADETKVNCPPWLKRNSVTVLSIAFGFVVGLAAASKINTVFISLLLPLALLIIYSSSAQENKDRVSKVIFQSLLLGGFFAVLSFRVFQPYAFEGPGFFSFKINPHWLNNIKEVSEQSSGNVDFPPALQWARRNFLFSGKNMTLWGLGLPLGVAAWVGVGIMLWRFFKGNWKNYLLILCWTLGYFLWQSSLGNPVIRYQLPVYPMFSLIAAWGINYLLSQKGMKPDRQKILKIVSGIALVVSVLGSFLWAFMFSSIYIKPITRIEASRWIYQNIPGPINLNFSDQNNKSQFIISYPYDYVIKPEYPYSSHFSLTENATLEGITITKIKPVDGNYPLELNLEITLIDQQNKKPLLDKKVLQETVQLSSSTFNKPYYIKLDATLFLEKEKPYILEIANLGPVGVILSGSAVANESAWDDGLPLRIDGYDAFGGIYQKDLVFEMYWEDNKDKLNRFLNTLNESDYIFISSNRQWGTTTRVPERYPLTTHFYRNLMGCADEMDVFTCYSEAQPGTNQGTFGFNLVKVFESYPAIGNFKINDQYADEAFTVYDHPKVMIFQKSQNYDQGKVHAILDEVDLQKVQYFTPAEYPDYPANLELPENRLLEQQQGGTWSQIFDRNNLVNSHPIVSLLVWYLTLVILGVICFPLVRIIFHGLADKGYAFSKLMALLIMAWLTWIAGSNGIAVSKSLIWIIVAVILLVNISIAVYTRKDLIRDLKEKKQFFIWMEIISLVLFLVFILIRLGNPDLWHPAKGGEKPMDFAYLNAVIKSSTYPPYDPWYASGYINYYYYGFVIVGVLIKWIGIIPSTAYNLVLATFFSFVGTGSFSVTWNLIRNINNFQNSQSTADTETSSFFKTPEGKAGIIGLLFTLILGNLATIRMFWHGLLRIGAPNGEWQGGLAVDRLIWTFKGLAGFIRGTSMGYYPGDWYWIPSRALPEEPITEFPFFTFIYADPHAHLYALPITILALGWVLSVLFSKWKFSADLKGWFSRFFIVIVGAWIVGSLKPTNTWDYPTYLTLTAVVLIFTILRYSQGIKPGYSLPPLVYKILEAVVMVLFLIGFSQFLYSPFTKWFGQAYTEIMPWDGTHSPFWSYFTHWGLFLFIITIWFITESIDWMAKTPISVARKYFSHKAALIFACLLILVVIIGLIYKGVKISWLVIPLLIWSGLLILRRDLPDSKRFVLFIIGTALFLTLLVELIVLKGDLGRMNTVFKFYLQAWVLFATGSSAALIWGFREIELRWESTFKRLVQVCLVILLAGAGLFPITATIEKINDRISDNIPPTLDGMTYMAFSTYFTEDTELKLGEDYHAIRWIQDNVIGSPVLVEANTPEYRWGSRYSIYTGLPSVIGWNWHQRQQRAVAPSEWVWERVNQVEEFYQTADYTETQKFLERYNVSLIIVGQLEKARYSKEGIDKFEQFDGVLWRKVYSQGETSIYQVKNDQK